MAIKISITDILISMDFANIMLAGKELIVTYRQWIDNEQSGIVLGIIRSVRKFFIIPKCFGYYALNEE